MVEKYQYRDFRIEICQNADTVGSEQPNYFAVAWNLQAKNPTGNLVDRESESIDDLKKAAAEYVDKRRARMDRLSKAES